MKRLEVVRGVWGLCQIFAPQIIAHRVLGLDPDAPAAPIVIRILGARQLAQAIATVGTDSVAIHRFGGVVDVLHATSMLALAALSRRRRRAAAIDCVMASSFAIAEFAAACRAR